MFKQFFRNIPLNKPLYMKTLVVILTLVVVGFALAVLLFEYELTKADPFGASVSAFLLAYLIHLSIWDPSKDGPG